MRFLVQVLAATGFGAVSVASLQIAFPQQKAAVVEAVRAAGTGVSRFQLSDLNPLRWIYDFEMREINSPTHKLDFPSSPPIAVGAPFKWTPVEIGQLGSGGMNSGSFTGNMPMNWGGSPGHRSRPLR